MNKIMCNGCNSMIAFEEEDIKWEIKEFDTVPAISYYGYVTCPLDGCGKESLVRVDRVNGRGRFNIIKNDERS